MIEKLELVCVGALALAMGGACGNKSTDTSDGAVQSGAGSAGEAKSDEAKSGAANGGAPTNAEVVNTSVDTPKDICKSFDKSAVANALGWQGINKVTGVGGSAKGVRHRNCGFIGKNANTDQHFGVTFSTAKEFDAQHRGFAATYEPRAKIGAHEARVAKTDDVVILQIETPEMFVTVDAAETGKTPAELEPKLEAAAIALLGSLPPDAKAILEKK